jgi:hypothetical protein
MQSGLASDESSRRHLRAAPRTVLLKNKVGDSGSFFGGKNCPSRHHVYHAIHHVFTTKTPQENSIFSENPL